MQNLHFSMPPEIFLMYYSAVVAASSCISVSCRVVFPREISQLTVARNLAVFLTEKIHHRVKTASLTIARNLVVFLAEKTHHRGKTASLCSRSVNQCLTVVEVEVHKIL